MNVKVLKQNLMKICLTWNFAHSVHIRDRCVAGRRIDGLRHRRTVPRIKSANIAEVRRREGERVLGVALLRIVTLLSLMVRGDLEPVVVDSRFSARRRV